MKYSSSTLAGAAAMALLLAVGPARTETAGELIRKAQISDSKLEAARALALYLQVEKLEPGNADALVGIARQYRHLMTDASAREEKLRLGALALAYSQRAALLAPDDSDAQLSPAISYGKMLEFQGGKEKVAFSRLIKASAEKALKLDPSNDLAWHVLGRWHQGFADLTGARRALGELLYGKLPVSTNEEAARCFEKALAANPRRLMHYIELGQTYARMGRTSAARRLIEKGLSMPNVEKEDPEMKQHGREALAKLR